MSGRFSGRFSSSELPDGRVLFEVCCDSVESALAAQEGGASRIELCSNLLEGGTTPNFGLIKQCKKRVSIPIHVMIRPRGGDFLYTEHELKSMQYDLKCCKEIGVAGVVFGFLCANGDIDMDKTQKFVDIAKPLYTTFHRAFDMCRQPPLQALQDIANCGINCLLTSGRTAS